MIFYGNSFENLFHLRPWISEKDGKSYVSVPREGKKGEYDNKLSPVTARLTKEQWIRLDCLTCGLFEDQAPHVWKMMKSPSTLRVPSDRMAVVDGSVDTSKANLSIATQNVLPLPFTHANFKQPFEGNGLSKECQEAVIAVANAVEASAFAAFLGSDRAVGDNINDLQNNMFFGPYACWNKRWYQDTPDCFRLVVGQDPITIQWVDTFKFVVCAVLQVRQ